MSNIYQKYTGECFELLGECRDGKSLEPMVTYRALPDGVDHFVLVKYEWEGTIYHKERWIERFKMVETDLSVEEFEELLRRDDVTLNHKEGKVERREFRVRKPPVWMWLIQLIPYVLLLPIYDWRWVHQSWFFSMVFYGLFAFVQMCTFTLWCTEAQEVKRMVVSQRELYMVDEEHLTTRWLMMAMGVVMCAVDVLLALLYGPYSVGAWVAAAISVAMTVVACYIAEQGYWELKWENGREVKDDLVQFRWYRQDMPVGGTDVLCPAPEELQVPAWGYGGDDEDDSLGLGPAAVTAAGAMVGSGASKGGKRSRPGADNAPLERILREEDRYHEWACGHDDPYECNEDECY